MTHWESLERWSPTAFLVAGGLLVVFSALVALEVFLGVNTPQALVAIPGLVAGFVGLFGLYPRLAEADSRLGLGGLVVLTIAGIGLLVLLVWIIGLTALYGIDSVKPPSAFIVVTILMTILGYVLIGLASARQAIPSRTVGLLVLGPPATLALMVLSSVLYGGDPPEWSAVVFSAMQAAAHLAIGYGLWTGRGPAERADAPSDTPA